ncbi:ATPase [Dokdonia sinensis]|uniref:ATPase n=1 Tax=Dokdonia sinensis TaxID=2479847 RepID=A0A3M0GGM5_9FLAO|nr:ATP-binding protein [Dokdonia sinensis]RMB64075.1 ATPase [Dokdonia sinensis]
MPESVLLIGGPSTGKTTLIESLKSMGYTCLDEVSREVIKEAQEQGIEQLFLEQPLLFSELLLRSRIKQFESVPTFHTDYVFLDRGIPDTVAYMDFINQEYSREFIDACNDYRYDHVFILPPWKEIHTTDGERYENFEQAVAIHKELINTYKKYSYEPTEIPKGAVADRARFILDYLKD